MNSIFSGMEKLSLVDFDGKLSCTLFTSGCNYKCPFCHNAPLIQFNKQTLEWEDIKAYLTNRKNILDAVVITGGEPTLHQDLKKYLKEIKGLGFLIKLDTNGSNPEMIVELINNQLVDYIAMDIKAGERNYSKVTGDICVDLNKIKKSIDIIKKSPVKYEFRTTLIKEYHTEEDIKELAKLISGAKTLFLQKFVLRETCLDQSLHEIDEPLARCYKKLLESSIEEVHLRGY